MDKLLLNVILLNPFVGIVNMLQGSVNQIYFVGLLYHSYVH